MNYNCSFLFSRRNSGFMILNFIRFTVNHTAQHGLCVRTRVLTSWLDRNRRAGHLRIFNNKSVHRQYTQLIMVNLYVFIAPCQRRNIRRKDLSKEQKTSRRKKKKKLKMKKKKDLNPSEVTLGRLQTMKERKTCPEEVALLKSFYFPCILCKVVEGMVNSPLGANKLT